MLEHFRTLGLLVIRDFLYKMLSIEVIHTPVPITAYDTSFMVTCMSVVSLSTACLLGSTDHTKQLATWRMLLRTWIHFSSP